MSDPFSTDWNHGYCSSKMFGSLQVCPFSGALSYGNRTVMNGENETESNEEKMGEERPRNIQELKEMPRDRK